ncbi:MAG: glycerol-3-phosphate 1-O-acyltransferase [Verrucomicrobia bacterium]|nr:MAG: glycerol-3-phosphate 1-O-acyltransferase [Verrucomicrobiota bacterium]
MFTPLLLVALVGYLLGALPFGWLIARKFGINIFEHGSKNPGATNVKRVLGEKFGQRGKRAGDLAFLLDALKGAASVSFAKFVAAEWILQRPVGVSVEIAAITGLIFALIGHSFSCFTRFKGGKGVATSAGGLVVLLPFPTLLAVIAWVAVFQTSRYVSLASIVASVVLPAAAWLLGAPTAFAALATLLGIFVVLRHRANIQRLLNGTENKFAKKTPAA